MTNEELNKLLDELCAASQKRESFLDPQWLIKILSIRALNNDAQKKRFRECLSEPLKRVKATQGRLKGLFVGKDKIIDLMIYCATAQEPMVVFGEPGTAKTAMVKRFAEELGLIRFDPADPLTGQGYFFEYLLTSFTEPDELFGPVLIKDLINDPPKFRRYDLGMMPQAGVVFLDEIFRANSAILNTLLSVVNERVIYEAGSARQAKTLVIFGAANEPPVSPEVNALYERFLIRAYSAKVPYEKKKELFDKGLQLEKRTQITEFEDAVCLADLALINRAILLEVYRANDQYIEAYCKNVDDLSNHGMDICRIDDRKFIKLHKVICAKALIEDGCPPEIKHQDILMHTWKDLDGRIPLKRSVIKQLGLREADYAD